MSTKFTITTHEQAKLVHQFWFTDTLIDKKVARKRVRLWLTANDSFGAEILGRFGSLPNRVADGKLKNWLSEDQSAIALIITLDQFPKNTFVEKASLLSLIRSCNIQLQNYCEQTSMQRFIHSKLRSCTYRWNTQNLWSDRINRLSGSKCYLRTPPELNDVFLQFAECARRHRKVIQNFGRFPHHNLTLATDTMAGEHRYLQSGGERFGAW